MPFDCVGADMKIERYISGTFCPDRQYRNSRRSLLADGNGQQVNQLKKSLQTPFLKTPLKVVQRSMFM